MRGYYRQTRIFAAVGAAKASSERIRESIGTGALDEAEMPPRESPEEAIQLRHVE